MTFAVARSDLQTILNRRDLTTDQANLFLKKGLRRINREVRCPAQEALLTWKCDGTPYINVPSDYLELISLFTDDTQGVDRLVRKDLRTVLRRSQVPGYPDCFYRQVGQFIIAPCPPAGTSVYINYYRDAPDTLGDTDESWVTLSAPDLLTYAALSYAGDFFMDDRRQTFEQRYQDLRQTLVDMGTQDELAGASISPAYTTDFC